MGVMQNKINIEVTYKGQSSIPCVYMEAAVKDILPAYDRQVTYSRLDIQSPEGKQRFLALSCSLFGEKGVYEHHRLAPIPALFMDGELVFDAIPPRDELEGAIRERLSPEDGTTAPPKTEIRTETQRPEFPKLGSKIATKTQRH
jgi:hypothetical protein